VLSPSLGRPAEKHGRVHSSVEPCRPFLAWLGLHGPRRPNTSRNRDVTRKSAWRPRKRPSTAKRPRRTWRRRNHARDQTRITAANDRGGDPATFVSRETPASTAEEDDAFDLPEDQFTGAEAGIEREYQGRLADARRLPWRERAGARRAAVDWYREMLKALAEKRRAARRAQIADWQRLRALRRAAGRDRPG
jgi:hypothetical protein